MLIGYTSDERYVALPDVALEFERDGQSVEVHSRATGAVYADLAWAHADVLRASPFLLTVGAALLLGYAWLGRRYWFSVPFRGIVLALVLYAIGAITALA